MYVGVILFMVGLCSLASNVDSSLNGIEFWNMVFNQLFYGMLCILGGLGLCWFSQRVEITRENGKLEFYLLEKCK